MERIAVDRWSCVIVKLIFVPVSLEIFTRRVVGRILFGMRVNVGVTVG